MNKIMKTRITIDTCFAISSFLAGLWYFFYIKIIEISTVHPAENSLLLLSIVHYVCFIYMIASFYLFYKQDSQIGNKSIDGTSFFISRFFVSWPAAIGSLIICYIAVKSEIIDAEYTVTLSIIILFIAVLIFGYISTPSFRNQKKQWITNIYKLFITLMLFIVLYIPYILLLSWISADAKVTSDKVLYKPGEDLIVNVNASGYVLLPRIISISNNYGDPALNRENLQAIQNITINWKIPIKCLIQNEYIEVLYEPQIISLKRKTYLDLKVVRFGVAHNNRQHKERSKSRGL